MGNTFMNTGPLSGIRVLEFSQIVAGPVAGVALAHLGADVVKIEPLEGEGRRNTGAVVPNEGKYFQSLNIGKRSLTVDLSSKEGRELIHRIVDQFDVVISNYRVGVTERLEIDYKTLSKFKPDLIYASITGFGEVGPSATRAGSDIVSQAYSGVMAAEGKLNDYGGPDSVAHAPIIDRTTGIVTAMGICAALHHRDVTGEGQELSLSLIQTALDILSDKVMREPVHDATLRDPVVADIAERRAAGASYAELLEIRKRVQRRRTAQRLYYSSYDTLEGTIVLGALTKQNREQARTLLGIRDDLDDPDYDTEAPGANDRFEAWRTKVQDILMERTAKDWVAAFLKVGFPATEVHFAEEMSDDPHVVETGMMLALEHPITGPQLVPGPTVRMSRTPTGATRSAPPLGYHSREILAEAGLSDAEIQQLITLKVIGDRM
jgi:crotonobetainyl-CoA:carnitine CoA-transferase CaiB-like acyl-CoA transferase